MKRLVLGAMLLAALLMLAACQTAPTSSSAPASAPAASSTSTTSGAGVFVADLTQLNGSGVSGVATVTIVPLQDSQSTYVPVIGTSLTIQISASGLVPRKIHAVHIHGLPDGRTSAAPPAGAGIVTASVGQQYYGQPLIPLGPFHAASAAGVIDYAASVTATSSVPAVPTLPLEGRAVVVHGLVVKGVYDPEIPVGFGVLHRVDVSPQATTGY